MISNEQWADVAADFGVTVDELHRRIAEVDSVYDSSQYGQRFDRDMEPITFGEWVVLYESVRYRTILETVLPNRRLILTRWHGRNDLRTMVDHGVAPGAGQPMVMETVVVVLGADKAADRVVHKRPYLSEAEARVGHRMTVQAWARHPRGE